MDITPDDLEKIRDSALKDINNASSKEELEKRKKEYLGKEGELNKILRSMSDIPVEKRREIGPVANSLKDELRELVNERREEFEERDEDRKVDVTKPGQKVEGGHLHPLTHVEQEVRDIFNSLNFSIVGGPQVESEYYNFTSLNIPADHPARDMWDTFWVDQDEVEQKDVRKLLRTHTSPVQIRYMEKNNPPFQMVVPGRVFRYEATDVSHEVNFYQLEGLMVGKKVSLANFKYIMEEFLESFFGFGVEFRFRPSYFPFTEPSVEVDIKLPESDEWLEILGAGMVHRNVFDAVQYNPQEFQGFAFGVGLDRLAMIKYDIEDIRHFYSGDLRFIKQF